MDKKLIKFAKKFKQNSVVVVDGQEFKVLGMNELNTTNNLENFYFKVQLEKHFCILIDPFDNIVMFGKKVKSFGEGIAFPKTLTYKGKTFKKDCDGYQLCKKQIFGPLQIEGECVYANYSCDNMPDISISPGYVFRTKSRDDYVLKEIEVEKIKVK